MSRSEQSSRKKKIPAPSAYHHGDLRQALLDSAAALAEEVGLGGLTLRAVARGAGVSHNAPYHHFADKAAIIEALAVDGWVQLNRALSAVPGQGAARLQAMGVCYVIFAVSGRARFQLMRRPELRAQHAKRSAVSDAAEAAFMELVACVIDAQAKGQLRAGDPRSMAVTAWVAVHGLATVLLDGLVENSSRPSAKALAQAVTANLIAGLGGDRDPRVP
jgi:AcrR family transcriptional regulator